LLLLCLGAGGRSGGAGAHDRTQTLHWLTCHVGQATDDNRSGPRLVLLDQPAEIPLYGTSLTMLLAAALETGDISHLETGDSTNSTVRSPY
jgi:hypothetical protein